MLEMNWNGACNHFGRPPWSTYIKHSLAITMVLSERASMHDFYEGQVQRVLKHVKRTTKF